MCRQYLDAVRTVLRDGVRKESRTGIDTLSHFAVDMRFDLRGGFPLLTTKYINWFHIISENLWFISGDPHIEFLRRHGIKFWNSWVDEKGNVPSAYGNFWRRFPVHGEYIYASHDKEPLRTDLAYNDQIKWVLDELRRNPMSRRLVVSAWAPGNAQTSRLPPCHVMWVLNTQNLIPRRCPTCGQSSSGITTLQTEINARCLSCGRSVPYEQCLCLHLTQRSCDMGLGVPYNIAGYAFLLHLFAHLTGMKPGIFHHTLVDAHIYISKVDGTMGGAKNPNTGELYDDTYNHRPALLEQLNRYPRPLPTLTIDPQLHDLSDVLKLLSEPKETILQSFQLTGYDPWPPIKMGAAV